MYKQRNKDKWKVLNQTKQESKTFVKFQTLYLFMQPLLNITVLIQSCKEIMYNMKCMPIHCNNTFNNILQPIGWYTYCK